MPGPTAVIHLPYSTRVLVQAFVNAASPQRFTITPPAGGGAAPVIITGIGDYDTPAGSIAIDTPDSGPSPLGAAVTVAIDHSPDAGRTWQPSQVAFAPCQLIYSNLAVVASEDSGGDTWCAATLYFSWSRASADTTRIPAFAPPGGSNYDGRA